MKEMLELFSKRQVPLAVAFATGMLILLQYFLKIDAWALIVSNMVNWNVIISAFALAVGMGNLFVIHSKKLRMKGKETLYSFVLLFAMVVWFIIGVSQGTTGRVYKQLWDNMLLPAQATMYSTTIFFITSAAYRAFRVKNAQAAVLLISALLVMGRVGIGAVLWPGFQTVSSWIMAIPNTAGMRAVTVGGGMALVGNSIRIILGLERNYLGGLGK